MLRAILILTAIFLASLPAFGAECEALLIRTNPLSRRVRSSPEIKDFISNWESQNTQLKERLRRSPKLSAEQSIDEVTVLERRKRQLEDELLRFHNAQIMSDGNPMRSPGDVRPQQLALVRQIANIDKDQTQILVMCSLRMAYDIYNVALERLPLMRPRFASNSDKKIQLQWLRSVYIDQTVKRLNTGLETSYVVLNKELPAINVQTLQEIAKTLDAP